MKLKFFCTVLLLLFTLFSGAQNRDLKLQKILHQMFDSIRNVKTLRLKVFAIERINGKFLSEDSEIKLLVSPRKLYFLNRKRKLEILFDAERSGHALVKSHMFPYLTLSLDPTGNLMRKNQHYTINEMGFQFIGYSIAFTISKDKNGLANFVYKGKFTKNGYNCYMIEYENRGFTYVDYKVGEKETLQSIANRLLVNSYLLHHKNEMMNEFGYIKKGKVIKVPTLFCKKAVIYIDEKLMLPVSVSLYDDAGLFESYNFSAIEINKAILENEFMRNYKDYGF